MRPSGAQCGLRVPEAGNVCCLAQKAPAVWCALTPFLKPCPLRARSYRTGQLMCTWIPDVLLSDPLLNRNYFVRSWLIHTLLVSVGRSQSPGAPAPFRT